MIIRMAIFYIGLLAGGFFLHRHLFRETIFGSLTLFAAGYGLSLLTWMFIGLPLNIIVVNWPLILIPLIFWKPPLNLFADLKPRVSDRRLKLLLFLAAVITLVSVLHIIQSPIFERDGLGIWLTKAKMITLDRGLNGNNFFDPLRLHDKPRYPLLIPLLEAALMMQTKINEWLVQGLFVYFWLLLLGTVYENLNRRSPNTALPGVMIILLLPAYYLLQDGGLHTGYADMPISLFYLTTLVFLDDASRLNQQRHYVGAGLAAAAAVFTKNEGYAFGLALMIITALNPGRISRWLALTASMILPLIPWLLTVRRLPSVHQEHYLHYLPTVMSRLNLAPTILYQFLREITRIRHWGLLWFILPISFAWLRPGRQILSSLLILGLTLGMYLFVFLLTPWDISQQMSIALPRLLLHLTPGLVYLASRSAALMPEAVRHA